MAVAGKGEITKRLVKRFRLPQLKVVYLIVLTTSTFGLSLITFHLLSNHHGDQPIEGVDFVVFFMLLLTTTLSIAALISMTDSVQSDKPDSSDENTESGLLAPADQFNRTSGKSLSKKPRRQLTRIVRSTKHLYDIEQELLRRIATLEIDPATGKLIAEIQICTRRILAQLDELEEPDEPASKTIEQTQSN